MVGIASASYSVPGGATNLLFAVSQRLACGRLGPRPRPGHQLMVRAMRASQYSLSCPVKILHHHAHEPLAIKGHRTRASGKRERERERTQADNPLPCSSAFQPPTSPSQVSRSAATKTSPRASTTAGPACRLRPPPATRPPSTPW